MALSHIFVNLKRFDISDALGGVCPSTDPELWIKEVMRESLSLGLDKDKRMELAFFLPEGLILPAKAILAGSGISIGCQGVFREDVAPGGNFGAFTTLRTAKAARNLGCEWALIGHSEERKNLLDVMAAYDPDLRAKPEKLSAGYAAVEAWLRACVQRAAEAGLKVLLCIGENAEERAAGPSHFLSVLQSQISSALSGTSLDGRAAIAYEPIWAIGPGKTPPDGATIRSTLDAVRDILKNNGLGSVPVVYGGGLKKENAAEVRSAGSDGGLIALTRFTGKIGFSAKDLHEIASLYLG